MNNSKININLPKFQYEAMDFKIPSSLQTKWLNIKSLRDPLGIYTDTHYTDEEGDFIHNYLYNDVQGIFEDSAKYNAVNDYIQYNKHREKELSPEQLERIKKIDNQFKDDIPDPYIRSTIIGYRLLYPNKKISQEKLSQFLSNDFSKYKNPFFHALNSIGIEEDMDYDEFKNTAELIYNTIK